MSSKFVEALATTRLYPITDRRLSGLSHAEQINLLGDAGAVVVQLREKFLAPREFYEEAQAAMKVARERKMTVLINDRVDIAVAVKADGVHLGQGDLSPVAARQLLGSDAIVGFSTHSVEQVREAAKFEVDYLAIGPIFPTSSKINSETPIGLDGLRQVRQVTNQPLVAIGGINSQNAADAVQAGADALAVIADIWSVGRPAAKIKDLLHGGIA